MAYAIKTNGRKDGSTTYNIMEVNRVPGTKNKHKSRCVEKLNSAELAEKGIADAGKYAEERLEFWKRQNEEKKDGMFADVRIPLGGRLEERDGETCNLGYALYSSIYHNTLSLEELINARRQHTEAKYNANVILQHLIYSRCLLPGSKLNTWGHRGMFYGDTDYTLDDVYRCMDDLLSWREDILRHMDGMVKEKCGRKETILYYDVTNYYFERDGEDDDLGLRARGVSKEHRPEPIIQMGLFMDELGLPVSYDLHRGNTADSLTLQDALDRSVIDFSKKRKIIVADKGMLSYRNILKIRNDRNGYVMSQSIRKSDAETVAFALDGDGWADTIDERTGEVTFRTKERTIPRGARSYGEKDDRLHSGSYNERQVFIWSRKYAERARLERQAAVEKAKEYAGTRSMDFRDSTYGKLKYVKKTPLKDGKDVDADRFRVDFDQERLEEDEKLDGYYIIVTNVVGLPDGEAPNPEREKDHCVYTRDGFLSFNRPVPASEIVDIYGGLWRIEETFKVTKTGMLTLRPVFHSRQDRIRAHFLICFIALLAERILERQLGWRYSSSTIQERLSSFNALRIEGSNIWQAFGYSGEVGEMFRTLGVDLPGQCFRQNDLRKLFASTKKKGS